MPRGRKKQDGPRQRDWVKCVLCIDYRTQYRDINSHWSVALHPKDVPENERFILLTNPTDKHSEPVFNTNITGTIHDAKEEEKQEIEHESFRFQQPKITDIFNQISKTLEYENKMLSNESYLLDNICDVINTLKKNSEQLQLVNLVENEENGYNSAFDSVLSCCVSLEKTEKVLIGFMRIIENIQYEVWDFEDLLIKWNFHGLRASKHTKCKQYEVLIYCCVCCKDPIYPNNGIGSIIEGRLVNIRMIIIDKKGWKSLKNSCNKHFRYSSGHWHNLDFNKRTYDEKCLMAQKNLFKIMVRMTKSFQADRQYSFNIASAKTMDPPVEIGNIGHGQDYMKKIRKYLATKVVCCLDMIFFFDVVWI